MVALERIRLHPLVGFDAVSVSEATIDADGGLSFDRRYAVVERTPSTASATDSASGVLTSTRERRLCDLEATYDLDRNTVTIGRRGTDDPQTFHLDLDRDCFGSWLSDYVGYPVEVVRDDESAFPATVGAPGPTVVSTGTLEEVASWYDSIDESELRRRSRPNLVIDAPAFWEDRLYDAPGRIVPFDVGSTTLQGINPCQGGAALARSPETGRKTPGFRETFVERREATLPEWATEAWFDHYFRLLVNARVPTESEGARLAVGDPVTVGTAAVDPSAAD